MKTLKDRIRLRRQELGMTQEELAQMLGYKSRSSINKIELGSNDIPQSKIIEFARALCTSPEYLMGWSDELDVAEEKDEELRVLSIYRELSVADRRAVLRMLTGLSQER